MVRKIAVLSFLSFFLSLLNDAGSITLQEQQAARDKVAQLTAQKQQKQTQLAANNTQIADKGFQLAKAQAKRFQLFFVTGGTKNPIGDLADTYAEADVKILQKEIADLQAQNKALEAEMAQIDSVISQQSSILSKPTKDELQQQVGNYNQTLKNHDDYINWLKSKGKSQQEIDDATRIKQNDEMRQNQIKQQLKDKDYIEPPPSSAPNPGPQGTLPSGPSKNQLTHMLNGLQNQLSQLQNNAAPPPGWSPVGESVSGPSVPSKEAQIASSHAADQNINENNQDEIRHLQNQIATVQQALQNGNPPPRGFDWNSWLQANSTPPQPTGGSLAASSGSSPGNAPIQRTGGLPANCTPGIIPCRCGASTCQGKGGSCTCRA